MGDMLDQSFYAIGDMKFRTASTTVEKLQRAYRESGFQIEKWDTVSVSYNKETESDVMTAFCLLAKKI